MRIALISPQPYIETRGTPMAVHRMVSILADLGHEVHIITFPFGRTPEAHPLVNIHRCKPFPFIKNVKIGFSSAKLLMDISVFMLAASLIRRNKFDCIHGVEEGAFMGMVLSRFTGVPFVYDMDSVMSHEISQSKIGNIPFMIPMARYIEHLAINKSSIIVTISDSMADFSKSIDHTKDIFVVPDVPILPDSEGPKPERAREQLPPNLREGHNLILYTGSLANYQGLDMLISAMRSVINTAPEAVLVIVGGDLADIERLKAATGSADMIDNLIFLGKKPSEQIPDFLSMADILVSPRRGGINPPAKIYTYMLSNRPIVATDVPANSSVLGDDGAFLVTPTPEGLADGILEAIKDSETAQKKAEKAKEKVMEITPELQAKRVKEAYDTLEMIITRSTQQDMVKEA
ncbi:MAG: glycosyltransferase [Armatimonadota bacterium]